jgi:hypothetical protein
LEYFWNESREAVSLGIGNLDGERSPSKLTKDRLTANTEQGSKIEMRRRLARETVFILVLGKPNLHHQRNNVDFRLAVLT